MFGFFGFAWIKWVIAGLVALAFGLLIWSWDSRGHALDQANKRIADLSAEVIAERTNAEIAKIGMDEAFARATELNASRITYNTITETIKNAPVTKDGPVAPVLRETLDAIRAINGPAAADPGVRPNTRSQGRSGVSGRSGSPADVSRGPGTTGR